jgi:hypothetical protein
LLANTVAVPAVFPSQLGLVLVLIVAVTVLAGSVIVELLLAVHPFTSVTVTVYDPAVRFVAV